MTGTYRRRLYRIFVKVIESGDFLQPLWQPSQKKRCRGPKFDLAEDSLGREPRYWTGGEYRDPPQPAALRGFRHRG